MDLRAIVVVAVLVANPPAAAEAEVAQGPFLFVIDATGDAEPDTAGGHAVSGALDIIAIEGSKDPDGLRIRVDFASLNQSSADFNLARVTLRFEEKTQGNVFRMESLWWPALPIFLPRPTDTTVSVCIEPAVECTGIIGQGAIDPKRGAWTLFVPWHALSGYDANLSPTGKAIPPGSYSGWSAEVASFTDIGSQTDNVPTAPTAILRIMPADVSPMILLSMPGANTFPNLDLASDGRAQVSMGSGGGATSITIKTQSGDPERYAVRVSASNPTIQVASPQVVPHEISEIPIVWIPLAEPQDITLVKIEVLSHNLTRTIFFYLVPFKENVTYFPLYGHAGGLVESCRPACESFARTWLGASVDDPRSFMEEDGYPGGVVFNPGITDVAWLGVFTSEAPLATNVDLPPVLDVLIRGSSRIPIVGEVRVDLGVRTPNGTMTQQLAGTAETIELGPLPSDLSLSLELPNGTVVSAGSRFIIEATIRTDPSFTAAFATGGGVRVETLSLSGAARSRPVQPTHMVSGAFVEAVTVVEDAAVVNISHWQAWEAWDLFASSSRSDWMTSMEAREGGATVSVRGAGNGTIYFGIRNQTAELVLLQQDLAISPAVETTVGKSSPGVAWTLLVFLALLAVRVKRPGRSFRYGNTAGNRSHT